MAMAQAKARASCQSLCQSRTQRPFSGALGAKIVESEIVKRRDRGLLEARQVELCRDEITNLSKEGVASERLLQEINAFLRIHLRRNRAGTDDHLDVRAQRGN